MIGFSPRDRHVLCIGLERMRSYPGPGQRLSGPWMNAVNLFLTRMHALNQDPFTDSTREKPDQIFRWERGPKLANNQQDRTKHRQMALVGRSNKFSKK